MNNLSASSLTVILRWKLNHQNAVFVFLFSYTTSPAAVMKLVVFFRSSRSPCNFWWSGVADGQNAVKMLLLYFRTFTTNMRAFGLSKELCLEFLRKQSTIADLKAGNYSSLFFIALQWNIFDPYNDKYSKLINRYLKKDNLNNFALKITLSCLDIMSDFKDYTFVFGYHVWL